MDRNTILFALHETEGFGWKTIRRLVAGLGSLDELLRTNAADLAKLGIPEGKAKALVESLRPAAVERRLKIYEQAGIGWMTVFDDAYPELLRQTAQPPWVLYYKGDPALLGAPSLAVVGTRTPTAYGKRVAEELSSALSQAGFCIVSGLARGIDSAAHSGALRGKGRTVAVLGCGVEHIYPPENKGLYNEIAAHGLLLSEYPIGTPIHPGLFPVRNRIIAGLTLGTVVVEAASRSGSLITADQALEASRDVFAVPGPITSPKSRGAMDLIKQGAKIVTSVDDILEEYMHMITTPEPSYIESPSQADQLTEDEQKIYDLLSCEPTTIDELLSKSQINFGHLHSVLISLLLKKRIEQLPGSSYIAL